MKLQERNLSNEMQGEEVKLLQNEPKLLDPLIGENDLNDRLFGETTQKSFLKFRKASENRIVTFEGRESFTTTIRIQGELIITYCKRQDFCDELAVYRKKGRLE